MDNWEEEYKKSESLVRQQFYDSDPVLTPEFKALLRRKLDLDDAALARHVHAVVSAGPSSLPLPYVPPH